MFGLSLEGDLTMLRLHPCASARPDADNDHITVK